MTLVGSQVPRVDARKKVTGRAMFTAEILLPNMAHGVLLGSAVAAGRIERIDTTAAERAPGVVHVLTYANRGPLGTMPSGADNSVLPSEPTWPLQDDRIRYYGQYVALVIAETLEQAQHAAKLVDVRYRADSPVVSLRDPRAVRTEPAVSLGVPLQVNRGDIKSHLAIYAMHREQCGRTHGDYAMALDEAEVFVDFTYSSATAHAAPMEPHAAVAAWQDGELVVYTGSQWVDADRRMICAALRLAPEQVRVVSAFTGGAFGSKIATGWHTILAAVAAVRTGRPVKIVLTRQQVLTAICHRTESIQRFTLGASNDGKLLAMRHHTVTHTIAERDENEYVEPTSRTSRMMYACDNYAGTHKLVRLNVMKPSWVRAPGEALCLWGLESALDELAYELDLDPIELRRRNHATVHPGDGKPFSSKHLLECYERGAARFGWAKRDPRPGSMTEGETQIGWGMATATYPGLALGATVRLRLEPVDGGVLATVSTAGSEIGQGAYTMMAVTAADELGLPLDRIDVLLGDTHLTRCGTTGGSALTASTAPAIRDAARKLRDDMLALVARMPNGFPGADQHPDDFVFADGQIRHRGNAKAISYGDLVAFSGRNALEAEATTPVVFAENDRYAIHSFGAVFVEVRVDREIGSVRVSRVVGVYDIGRVLSAATTRSQLIGGIVWGIGQALLEGMAYDPNKGMPLNPDFGGYLVPVNADIPSDIDVSWLDIPDYNFNSLGCRGAGEISITGVAAAIANAVYHATGIRVRDLPIAPEALL